MSRGKYYTRGDKLASTNQLFEFSVVLTIVIIGHYKVYCFLKPATDNSVFNNGYKESLILSSAGVWKSIARKEIRKHKEICEDLPG